MTEEEKREKRVRRDIDRMLAKARRKDRISKFLRMFRKPMQYKRIRVPDWNARTEFLSGFRTAYADFFCRSGLQENSTVQSCSTQLFWHRLHLQKLRMNRLGITMAMESERVKRADDPAKSIEEVSVFDGRYIVSEVNEAICSKRTFFRHGRGIGTFRDYDSVNYSILSAKQQGKSDIVCPNCGSVTTREKLIDGCDYCGTKFSVEDLENRVGGFDFVFEIASKGSTEQSRELRMKFDEDAAKMIRAYDPNFSYRSFKANLYNKMAAIHFADSFRQISAFSSEDLFHLTGKYDEIVNIDFDTICLWDNHGLVKNGASEHNDYYVENGIQHIKCAVEMVLFGLVDGKIKLRNEVVKLELEKSADCKAQTPCGPSVFRCKGCGASLSLMDGKACHYCGKELNFRKYDWVITKYESSMSPYGHSWRDFN